MSIINDALKKTQQKRKMEKEKRAQMNAQASAATPPTPPPAPTPTLKPQPVLKKGESAEKEKKAVQKSEFLFTWKMASLLTVAALLAMMAYANYQRAPEVTPQPYVQAAASKPVVNKVKVAFEGVFLSDNARVALINKQSLHLGDNVNGMKIVAISQDTVDLQGDDGVIQIKAGATYLL